MSELITEYNLVPNIQNRHFYERHRDDNSVLICHGTDDTNVRWTLVWRARPFDYHRLDGPAIITQNGRCEWHMRDRFYTWVNEYLDHSELSDQEKVAMVLRWGLIPGKTLPRVLPI